MARHAQPADSSLLSIRAGSLVLLWVTGLVAGFFALLGSAAKYTTCTASSKGLACRPGGFALSIADLIAVIVVVTAATLLTHNQRAIRILAVTITALALLGVSLLGTRALLDTA